MPITMNDLTISPRDVAMNALLADWQWAMPEPLRPVLLTAMGDVFAQGESGTVYFIDVVGGEIDSVADDGATFQELLTNNQFVTERFFPARIVQLRKAGKTLEPQQVYSHERPLVLGGDDEIDNIEPTDVSVHVSIHGQIHQQIKDLPEGTPISQIKIEER
ncbi:MAG TPA: T6SS immunity protein Tdi1 domain-containing protein [Planctomycetaceae bacterium]|nr:T6SS immunity protein Tdi1 domain-containing protein [Planctomycetaceae bacterium]